MSLATLAEIGIKAIQLQEAIDHRKVIGKQFGEACASWKRANHLYDFIAKHSDEWDRMMKGVSAEYSAIRRAKDDEKNARARLSRACLKAQKELAAGASTGVIAAIQNRAKHGTLA